MDSPIAQWISDQVTAGGGQGVVFGLSGGVDSAVVAGVAQQAFPGAALAVVMPCHSDPADAADAQLVANHFGLTTITVDLTPTYDALATALSGASPGFADSRLALMNVKPRLRMATLYALANERGLFVLGTSNLSELSVGYFTKHADNAVDLMPIGGLVKHEVYDLAAMMGVPERILTKPPSAGLRSGQTDEEDLGFAYRELDTYLLSGIAGGRTREKIEALQTANEHKRRPAPVGPHPGGRRGRAAGEL